ncbi:MAG: sulfotransferase [Thermoplasmata archaeon]
MIPSGAQQGVLPPAVAPATGRTSQQLSSAQPTTGPRRLKLVYIVGEVRSGSTLHGILLGAHPGVRTTGELCGLPARFHETDRGCSCLKTAHECEFWSAVEARCQGRVDLARLERDQDRYESYRSLPKTLLQAAFGSPALRDHVRRAAEFFRVIAEVGGAEVVIDLSKRPVRGYVYSLCREAGLDVYFLHVVRDSRAVVYSRMSKPGTSKFEDAFLRRTPWNLGPRWAITNLLSSILCSRPRDRYLRVRYEDLVADPARALAKIGAFLQVDFSDVAAAIARKESIPVSHIIGANRVRLQQTIQFTGDFAWRSKLSPHSQKVVWGLAGWLALTYGYQWRE